MTLETFNDIEPGDIVTIFAIEFDLLKKGSGAIYADLHRQNVEETVRTSASEMYNEEIAKIEALIRSEVNPQSENVYVLSEYLNYLKELKTNVLKWKKTS